MRVAVNQQSVSKQVVNLSAMVAYEGVPLHAPYFAKLWYEIYQSEQVDKDCVTMLCNCSSFIDYVDAVLLDERQSLNNQHIYQFFCNYFPKVGGGRVLGSGRKLSMKLSSVSFCGLPVRFVESIWDGLFCLSAVLLAFSQ